MKSLKNLALVAMTSLVLASCGTTQQVPLTGRTHRISVSDEQVLSLSNQEYTKYMASAKKSRMLLRLLWSEGWFRDWLLP